MLKSSTLKNRQLQAPLIFISLVLMGAGVLGGLARLGWMGGVILPPQVSLHGPLMILGFLATFVSLERAVAFVKPIALLVPASFAIASVLCVLGVLDQLSSVLWIIGCVGLIGLLSYFLFIDRQWHSFVLLLGAVSLFFGTSIFVNTHFVPKAVYWWMTFFVLTITAERLELSRLIQTPRRAKFLFAILSTMAFVSPMVSQKALAVSYVLLSLWLLRFDIAIRTIRFKSLARFTAICLICANLWLGASGMILWHHADQVAGPLYDATLHSLFVGFVFSMIFGHAPIILPAVTGLRMEYKAYFYIHVGLLQISLLLRMIGDFIGIAEIRFYGSVGNALAILFFAIASASSVFLSNRKTLLKEKKN